MLPLSFKEFLDFYNVSAKADKCQSGEAPHSVQISSSADYYTFEPSVSVEEKFQKYLQFGGMPILREYQFNEARVNQALEGIYSTVVLRDILQRNKQADQNTLHKIMMFLCSNIGSVTSPNSIGSVLANEGEIDGRKGKAMAGKTVDRYITMLQSAFIFYPVGRYDVKGKQLLKTMGKNYIIDLGFRNMLLGYRDVDRGHIIENVVFLELLRRDYRISIGKVGETEVDFVAEKPNEKLYVQVTESMAVPETRERELRPLRLIRDNYEKIVLSMDRSYINSYDGIKSLNLIDWLLEGR
jgi:hypothetical protein